MLKNYILITWRQLRNNPAISFVNIGGLAIGIACSILLLSYVSFEYSYDGQHARKKDIYRVGLDFYQNGREVIRSAETYAAVGAAMKKDFPEVEETARLYNMGYKNNCVFSYGNLFFRETHFLYAEPSFLRIFSFPFVAGEGKSSLDQPFTAVVSESMARKLFGDGYRDKAIGQSIQMNDDDRNSELCRITGIFKDIPENSHIRPNVLISYATLSARRGFSEYWEHNWSRKDFYTYVLLRAGTDAAAFGKKLDAFSAANIPGEKELHQQSKLTLEPLEKIHLSDGRTDEPEATIPGKGLVFLTIIAFFVITIAWVNYINLATAGGVNRAKEVGIRKVLGSGRSQLIRQFFAESLGLNMLSFLLGLGLIYMTQPFLYPVFGVHFSAGVIFTTAYGWLFITFLLAGAFLSGLYPALVLSSFRPVSVLKGKLGGIAQGVALRRVLVVFQFALSVLLIIGTVVVYEQVHFMLNRDIGIKPAQILVLDRPGRWDTARSTHNLLVQRFRDALLRDPSVEAVGMSDELPGKEIRWPSNYALKDADLSRRIPINTTLINQDYIAALGLKLIAGRNFSDQMKTDVKGLILTESAVKVLGFSHAGDIIGKVFRSDDGDYTVLGVVNDFNQLSLEKERAPAAFQFNGKDLREFEYYLVKLKADGIHQTMSRIQAAWASNFKGNPFDIAFLDEYFNRQYQQEIRFELLFGVFALLTIVVACIGLFALVAFMVRQRKKEIGVRKVLGAGIGDIVVLLMTDYTRLIGLANLIAWPLGWFFMNSWLTDFAYRIQIGWYVFLLAGLITLLIALCTISVQAVKAAVTNPVRSLRTE